MLDKDGNIDIGVLRAVDKSCGDNPPREGTSSVVGGSGVSEGHCTVDLGQITQVCSGLHNEFVSSFKGLPLKVDETLEGGRYYIAVSRDLYKEIVAKTINSIEGQEE